MSGPRSRTETQVNGVIIVADSEENRVMLIYPRLLTRDEYKKVRSFGFKWDRERQAYCRKMGGTKGAEYAAKMLADQFAVSP